MEPPQASKNRKGLVPPEAEAEMAALYARLEGQFPLVTTDISIEGQDWRVTAMQNQDALLEVADELEHFPYGLLLWESAVGLARFLAANPALVAGKRVLELGAGVGLPGLVAQTLGAQVWQTDHQPGALSLARWNAWQNRVQGVERFLADWRLWGHTERYEVLLGADILYERAMHFYLEAIFRQNLLPGGHLLLSDPVRPQAMEFAAHLEKSGWQLALETQSVHLTHEPKPVEVALLVARRDWHSVTSQEHGLARERKIE